MQKWKFTCLLLVVSFIGVDHAHAQNPALVRAYIAKYKEMAMVEQVRSGIPAAITLAQGIHETGAGTSELAVEGNNHFGIKCKRGWKGQTMKHTDDRPNECFRKYSSAGMSYKDHSDYLMKNPRYAALFKLSTTDYAAWALGLRRAGYATNPKYAQMLIKLIEDYKLQEYTYAALNNNLYSEKKFAKNAGEVVPEDDNGNNTIAAAPKSVAPVVTTTTPTPVVAKPPTTTVTKTSVSNSGIKVEQQVPAEDSPAYRKVVKVYGLRAVYARKGESPLEYAIRNSIRYNKFLEINDLKDEPLPADMYLYLDRKHFKGPKPYHMVKPGETMQMVAQAEGMQLKSLLELNLLAKGEEALPGTTLVLQEKATEKPKTWANLKDDKSTDSKPKVSSPKTQNSGYVSTQKRNTTNTKMAIDYVHPNAANATATKPLDAASKTVAVNTPPVAPPAPAYAVDSQQMELNSLKDQFDKVLYTDNDAKPKVVKQRSKPIKKDTVVKKVLAKTDKKEPVAKPIDTKKADNKKVVIPVVATTTPNTTTAPPVPAPPTTAKADEPAIDDNTVRTRKVAPITRVVVDGDTVAKNKKPIEQEQDIDTKVADKQTDKVKKPLPVDPTATKQIVDTPKSELDMLKHQFDQAIYASADNKPKVPATKPKSGVTTTNSPTQYYTVKKGDTAFSIAKKHNITMSQLMDWNDLDFGPIKEGMKLKVKE